MKIKIELEYCELVKINELLNDEVDRLTSIRNKHRTSSGANTGLANETLKYAKLKRRVSDLLKENERCGEGSKEVYQQANRAWNEYHKTEKYWDY